MSNLPDNSLEVGVADRLKEFGLTEYEAHTLIALVRLGTATAREVAEMDDVPRSRVYDAVEALHERGLVDIHYTTPQKYTVKSRESVVRLLDAEREQAIESISEGLEQLEGVDPDHEQFGVWTVTGQEAVRDRVLAFIGEAEHEVVYITQDDLLTEDDLEALGAAGERGVAICVSGVSDEMAERVRGLANSVTLFEMPWEWSAVPMGRLIVIDRRTALVSVRVERPRELVAEAFQEVAIWGTGERNSLVVVLRAILSNSLESPDQLHRGDGETG